MVYDLFVLFETPLDDTFFDSKLFLIFSWYVK